MVGHTDVAFPSGGDGETCRGWLYQPQTPGPFPVVVMAHGLGAVKEMRLAAYAERFSRAGYACLVFDYRHFGDSDGHPRQVLEVRRQLEDWAAAIAFARRNPHFRAEQVILWGTSFGGGHVIASAARDREIAAAIVQCPFTDGIASAWAMDWRSSLKVTALALTDWLRGMAGKEPLMVATAGRRHAAAMMTAPDAMDYLSLVPSGMPFRNEIAARAVLDIIRYRPGRMAGRIGCPILFCVCESDTVAQAQAAFETFLNKGK